MQQQAHIAYLGGEAGLNGFSTDDDYNKLKEMTDLRYDPALQDASPEERLRRVDNYLVLRGGTPEQIAEIHASYARAGYMQSPNVEIRAVPVSERVSEDSSDANNKSDPFLLYRFLDKGSQHIGSVAGEFGNLIDSNPTAKLALEGLDFVSGPVPFLVKKVPIVEKVIDAATGEINGVFVRGFEGAGYEGKDVQDGAMGGTLIAISGISGIAGAVKKLGKSIDFSRNTIQATERAFEQAPTQIKNAELLGADGKLISRQNPVTGSWETGVPALSKDGVNTAVESVGTGPNRIYSARELLRRVEEPGPFHNFPETLNTEIFNGTKTIISDKYTLYTKEGTLKLPGEPIYGATQIRFGDKLNNPSGQRIREIVDYTPARIVEGTYELGVRPSTSGNTEVITHRFFRPKDTK